MTKWVTKNFDDFFDMLPTNTLSRDKLNDQFGTYQNIHYGDVLIKYPFCLDCSNNEIPYINEGENFNKTELKEGDVVFADTAEDDTVGKCVEVLNIGDRKIVSGLHTYLCRPKLKMAPGYLGYFLNSDAFHNQLLRYIAGSKVSSVNKTSIKNTCIFYPESLAEQRRIAGILSSADRAIAASEALIEKYRNIKHGLLTTLLQPKEGWKKVKLGECCEVNPHNSATLPDSFFYIDLESVISGKLIKNQFISKKEAPSRAQRLVLHNDILYQTVRPYQKNNYIFKGDNNQYVASTGYALLRVRNNVDADFIYHMVHTHEFVSEVLGLCTGTSYPAITPSLLNKIEISVPYKNGQPDLAEQRRIAEILSSVDAKIAAEEKVVEKYKGVKKGLMEEMLGSGKD